MNRRSFLTGLIAAPIVIRAASLMPVRGIIMPIEEPLYGISPIILVRIGIPMGTWRLMNQGVPYRRTADDETFYSQIVGS